METSAAHNRNCNGSIDELIGEQGLVGAGDQLMSPLIDLNGTNSFQNYNDYDDYNYYSGKYQVHLDGRTDGQRGSAHFISAPHSSHPPRYCSSSQSLRDCCHLVVEVSECSSPLVTR